MLVVALVLEIQLEALAALVAAETQHLTLELLALLTLVAVAE
jgi:hypothetical protein